MLLEKGFALLMFLESLGSLYEILAAKGKRLHPNPIGEWNQARIISKNNKVEHWLNGYKILEYKRGGKGTYPFAGS